MLTEILVDYLYYAKRYNEIIFATKKMLKDYLNVLQICWADRVHKNFSFQS
jgi:hypothetical protein